MQRNRSILDSYPETVNLNQGSTSSNASGDPTSSWDSLRNSMEGRLSDSMLSSARGSLRRADGISYNTQNCSARDQGESSSSANLHGIGHAWPSSSSDHVLTNSNSEERRFGPSNALHPDSSTSIYGGNHLIGSPTILPNLASAHSPANANLSGIYNNGDTRLVMRPSVSSTVYTSSSRREAERPASGVSYNAGTSSGGLHSVPRNVSPNSRGGSSSSLNVVSPDSEDEANFWSSIRNNRVPLPVVPAPETGNMVQDSTNWSLATSNASYPRNMPSSSALSRGPSMQTSTTARTPYQNLATRSTRSSSEISPRTLLPPVESDFGSQRGNFSLLSSAASPVEEAEISLRSSSQGSSSRRNHRNHLISSLMTNFPSNEVGGSRGLASDIEGRHRLIRHVLHSMRRGENRQSEDYMMLDSFLNGAAEIHDTHRGMRLDVDNMSYEELLALEERIGNVNTGLSEGTILKRMRRRKHDSISGGSSSNMEPCCICREEYTSGDYMGILDCGHEFHSSCIKQWLMLKNVCPICKNTALKK
ncbi:E3 ubiquitin-protein ligase MBR2-like isoform X5 [Solanum lycopersicum]|uniref:E3 ubiquitin-protein ligase MBR2-like isoform X5 n=1 Tax=Solanum lycopersicum TaxID=4081 RepID=UPI003749DB8F